MKRFLYLRCYDSLELLSSLKVLFVLTVVTYHIVRFVLDSRTLLNSFYHHLIALQTLHYRIRQQEACGSQVGVLMIDRFVLESAGFLFGWIHKCSCFLRFLPGPFHHFVFSKC